ncbi:MAG: hypothetical protein H0U70_11980 [Tatlockia sp.]|nr:hypothetical protein [Tatlockia sp.]
MFKKTDALIPKQDETDAEININNAITETFVENLQAVEGNNEQSSAPTRSNSYPETKSNIDNSVNVQSRGRSFSLASNKTLDLLTKWTRSEGEISPLRRQQRNGSFPNVKKDSSKESESYGSSSRRISEDIKNTTFESNEKNSSVAITGKRSSPRLISMEKGGKSSPKGNSPKEFLEESLESNGRISNPTKKSPRHLSFSNGKPSLKNEINYYETHRESINKYLDEKVPLINIKDREFIEHLLRKALPFLANKEAKPEVVIDDKNLNYLILIVPFKDIKTQIELQEKTALLVIQNDVKGKGACSKVVQAYDLLSFGKLQGQDDLAVKLFPVPNINSLKIEIENLRTVRLLFNCYQLKEVEFAIVMKSVAGDDLLKRLYFTNESAIEQHDNIFVNYCTQKKKLGFDFTLDVLIKLMKRVIKLHEFYQLMHRDLKPSNIKVLEKNGKIKLRLIDFGDAVPVDSKISGDCGTSPYTHPAIWAFEDPQPYGIFAEIYSLAVIFAEILTKKGERKGELNFQQFINDEKKKIINIIFDRPKIKPQALKEFLDDVLQWDKQKTLPESYEKLADFKSNIKNFIRGELKILTQKMFEVQLGNLSLKDEMKRLKTMQKSYRLFSIAVEQFWGGHELENMIKDIPHSQALKTEKFKLSKNECSTYDLSFFSYKPITKSLLLSTQKEAIREATEAFKQKFSG